MRAINISIPLFAFFVYLIIPSFGAPAVTEETVYDQRQNGSENIRVHVNDVVIVHAPVEALIAFASLTDDSAVQQQLMDIIAGSLASSTPSTATKTTTEVVITSELSDSSSENESTSATTDSGSVATSEKPVLGESTKPPKKTK